MFTVAAVGSLRPAKSGEMDLATEVAENALEHQRANFLHREMV